MGIACLRVFWAELLDICPGLGACNRIHRCLHSHRQSQWAPATVLVDRSIDHVHHGGERDDPALAVGGLCGYFSYLHYVVVDFGYSAIRKLSTGTMEEGGDHMEREVVGCELEFVGHRAGYCEHHHRHE